MRILLFDRFFVVKDVRITPSMNQHSMACIFTSKERILYWRTQSTLILYMETESFTSVCMSSFSLSFSLSSLLGLYPLTLTFEFLFYL